MVTLRFMTCMSLKWPSEFIVRGTPSGVVPMPGTLRTTRPVDPPMAGSGHSTLMTSAPRSASQRHAHGPARTHVKSRTRSPSSGRFAMPVSSSGKGAPPWAIRGPSLTGASTRDLAKGIPPVMPLVKGVIVESARAWANLIATVPKTPGHKPFTEAPFRRNDVDPAT
jgi:hypothetical protein